MMSLEVKGQMLSPAFDRGGTPGPRISSQEAGPESCMPSGWSAQPPSLSSAPQSLLSDLEIRARAAQSHPASAGPMNGAAYYFVTWSEKIEKAYQYMKRRKKDDVCTGTSAQC